MRIIVCGSREWKDRRHIERVLDEYMPEVWSSDGPTIVHGDCRGADRIAAAVAKDEGLRVEPHPADWGSHGRAAGPIRNREMAVLGADLCIAFGWGTGTRNMVEAAVREGIPVRCEVQKRTTTGA